MRASQILQNSLGNVLSSMHVYRRQALAVAVEALLGCNRLVLMDLARRCEGYQYVKPALKRMDRLLANPHLHAERETFYRATASALIRGPNPLVLIDWSPIKDGRDYYLLRAAVPVSGRAIVVLDAAYPAAQLASPVVERAFLQKLASILPTGTRPIVITDAGFRGPWCTSVSELGWHWITRLRNRTYMRAVSGNAWISCKSLYELAYRNARDIGLFEVARSSPVTARVVLNRQMKKQRHDLNRAGQVARNKRSKAAAAREREPWILLCCPDLPYTARQVVNAYAQRMQIEQTFRDLKSTRYGNGFECSLTRKIHRIEILLLIQMLAVFVAWIAGLLAIQHNMAERLNPCQGARRLYSMVRVGREAITRGWLGSLSPPGYVSALKLLEAASRQGSMTA